MSQFPTADQLDEFERILVQWYRENCNSLIRRLYGFGERDEIRSAIGWVLARIFANYRHGEPAPDNLGGFVYQAVRNKLIDSMRRAVEDAIDPEELDERLASDDPCGRRVIDPEVKVAWRELLGSIFDRLEPKWRKVTKMMLQGRSPKEIGDKFKQDGYVLRRYARQLICQILTKLAKDGDDLARGFAQDVCPDRGRA